MNQANYNDFDAIFGGANIDEDVIDEGVQKAQMSGDFDPQLVVVGRHPDKKSKFHRSDFASDATSQLQSELWIHILVYALPTQPKTQGNPFLRFEVQQSTARYAARRSDAEIEAEQTHLNTKKAMAWVASLRTVNKHFQSIVDDNSLNACLWHRAAETLGLDPPRQLYSGGTYGEVCQFLLADVKARVKYERRREWSTACMMPRRNVPAMHPNPQRPPVILPRSTFERILKTARGLETFVSSFEMSLRSLEKTHYSYYPVGLSWYQTALCRYRMFLHLKQTHPNVWLVPTADIEYCWIAHIIRTEVYWEDMKKLSINPKHSLLLNRGETASFHAAVNATEVLWNATFTKNVPQLRYLAQGDIGRPSRPTHGPLDHFSFVPAMGEPVSSLPSSFLDRLPKISLSPDEIKADREWIVSTRAALQEIRQKEYDVIGMADYGRSFADRIFNDHLVPSYERFLNLCPKFWNKEGAIAPPYVLDLIWHAHQIDPVLYRRDCMEFFGRELLHHPWPKGLGVSSPVSEEFHCVWKETYGSSMFNDWQLQAPAFPF